MPKYKADLIFVKNRIRVTFLYLSGFKKIHIKENYNGKSRYCYGK